MDEFGFGYRLSALSIEVGYCMGKVMDMSQFGEGVSKEDMNLTRTSNLRIFPGTKI